MAKNLERGLVSCSGRWSGTVFFATSQPMSAFVSGGGTILSGERFNRGDSTMIFDHTFFLATMVLVLVLAIMIPLAWAAHLDGCYESAHRVP
jgi:hypothetical protein